MLKMQNRQNIQIQNFAPSQRESLADLSAILRAYFKVTIKRT